MLRMPNKNRDNTVSETANVLNTEKISAKVQNRLSSFSIQFDDEIHDANTGQTTSSLLTPNENFHQMQTFGMPCFSKKLTRKQSALSWKPEFFSNVLSRRVTCGHILDLKKHKGFHLKRDIADAGEFTLATDLGRKHKKRRHSHLGVKENSNFQYIFTLPGISCNSSLEQVKSAFKAHFRKNSDGLKRSHSHKSKSVHEVILGNVKIDVSLADERSTAHDSSTIRDTDSINTTSHRTFGPPVFAHSLQSKSSCFSWKNDLSDMLSSRSSYGDIVGLLRCKSFHTRRNVSDTNEFTLALNSMKNHEKCRLHRHSHIGEIGERNYASLENKVTIAGIHHTNSLQEVITSLKSHFDKEASRKRKQKKSSSASKKSKNNQE